MNSNQLRDRMVENQIVRRGVRDPAVLAAMREVPREVFVGAGLEEVAYDDCALPIAAGQTISQPYIVAVMAEAASIGAEARVLEIGAGSGYASAILSRIAREVYAIERHAQLSEAAIQRFRHLGYDNISLKTGDGSHGWPDRAPFGAILVSAGVPTVSEHLKDQLKIGGILVAPVGPVEEQRLKCIARTGEKRFEESDLGAVRFIRLITAAEMEVPPP